ncbi:MAG: hypothetical protein AAF988_08370, partial [Pseudomonadota bacterium]
MVKLCILSSAGNSSSHIMTFTDRASTFAQSFTSLATQFPSAASTKLYDKVQKARATVSTASLYLTALREALYGDLPLVADDTPKTRNPTPASWKQRVVTLAGYPAKMTTISQGSKTDTAIFLLGHNTEAEYYAPLVERLMRRGTNIRILELPDLENKTHYQNGRPIEDVYRQFVSAAVLDANSEVLSGIPDHHRKTIVTHSGSSQGFEREIRRDPQKANYALAHYDDRIIHTGIILETTKSSIFFNPVLCSLYLSYTSDLLHFLLRAKNERISSQKVAST